MNEALTALEKSGERRIEAELYRLQGELLLQDDLEGAEGYFGRALEVSRQQSAKSLELRAAMGLCRLYQRQGKLDAAREVLFTVYSWFGEGFGTRDLLEAKALLAATA